MALIMYIGAITTIIAASLFTAFMSDSKAKNDSDVALEALIVAIIMGFIWLSAFAIVFRNSIKI